MNAIAASAPTSPRMTGPRAFMGETMAQFGRWMNHLKREPFNIMFTLVQPVLWMVFFGTLMRGARFASLGEKGVDYPQYMSAGILTFTIYGNAMAGGIPMLFDRENGFLTRLLAAPISRGSIIMGRFLFVELVALAQTLVILGIAMLMGVNIATGIWGVLGILVFGALLGLGLTAISLALAFKLTRHGSFFMILGTLSLPLLFTSNALAPMTADTPAWLRAVASVNPISFCADAMRQFMINADAWKLEWTGLGLNFGALVLFDVLLLWWASRVMRRSLA